MAHGYHDHTISDEERREFLKALGVGGAVAVGGATLGDVREAVSEEASEELAPIGQAIHSDTGAELDAGLLGSSQAAFAEAATALPETVERGFPTDGPRDEFAQVAQAGQPVYEHLTEVGFFESTTNRLPEFTPEYLQTSVEAFVQSAALAEPLTELGFSAEESVDLVATVVSNAERLSQHHWVATDQIPREQVEFGEFIPPMTQGAAGGVLLWLEDLDQHLWQDQVLLTESILSDAAWHAHSMAAGFQLMTEGAKMIADESGELSDGELGALISTGFALQAISQNLLPQDVYWITEEMRAPRQTR